MLYLPIWLFVLNFCRISMTLSKGNIHQSCTGPSCLRRGPMWRAMWWFGWKWMWGYNSSKSCRYATMFSSNNCEWSSDIWYDVPQHTAMARCIILWKTLSQQAVTSWSWPGGQVSLDQSCATETGMLDSKHVFHWSAFSFPCPGFPKSWGDAWWYSGQMMLSIFFCSSISSCLVTLSTNTSCSFFPHAGCSKYPSPMITTFSQLFLSFDVTEDGEDSVLSWACA